MIDLHCHILPELDDGARSLEDSLGMARQALEDGISAVCATPHIRHDHNVSVEQIAPRVHSLQEQLQEHGLDIRVLPGGELAQTEADRLTDAQLYLCALGGAGGWLLLEPAPGPLSSDLEALVQRLAQRGFLSIIAHPERHADADFRSRLQSLVSVGALIQWTAEFLAEAVPGELALSLAGEGLVHLLGSDAHSSYAGRAVALAAGFARLSGVWTPARTAWTVDQAPQAIVRGEPVIAPP